MSHSDIDPASELVEELANIGYHFPGQINQETVLAFIEKAQDAKHNRAYERLARLLLHIDRKNSCNDGGLEPQMQQQLF